jgi:hypothetical protein
MLVELMKNYLVKKIILSLRFSVVFNMNTVENNAFMLLATFTIDFGCFEYFLHPSHTQH